TLHFIPEGLMSPESIKKNCQNYPEDIYIMFLSRSTVALNANDLIDAMNRNFSPLSLKIMMRRISRAKMTEGKKSEMKSAAVLNGYNQDLIELIDKRFS